MSTSILSHAGGGPGHARIALSGVALCSHHASERPGAYHRNHPGPHGSFCDVSATRAGILFVPIVVRSFCVADAAAAAHCAGRFPIANRCLSIGSSRQPCPREPAIIDSGVLAHMVDVARMEDEEIEGEIPYISGSGEGLMEEGPSSHASARRDEDIALDLMKFIAMTTGYGRTTSSGVGFQGTGSASKPDEYAAHLLDLYGKCKAAVGGKK